MRTFTVLVDSSCDMPEEFITGCGIQVLPMPFSLSGREYKSGYWQEISAKDFYNSLRKGEVATTSQINPDAFIKVFTEYAEQGKELLTITLSSCLSGSYQSALSALKEVKETHPDCNIHLVDSMNATIGQGLIVMLAVKKGEEGMSAAQTAEWLEQKRHSVFALFTVDDLMYLHRGGRLSKMSAVAGSLLGFKPVLNVSPDGTLKLKDRVRGRKASLEMMLTQMKRSVNPETRFDTVTISHGDCADDAEQLAERVRQTFEVGKVEVMMMGPVISAHVGPGVIAMFFEADMTRPEYEEKYYPGR
ncbi:MAG: DegV family protein [Oscillospiraceae bacterium]|nr:DegV family protein [Oscillospiraceae bacterium]